MEFLNSAVSAVNDVLWSYAIIIVLVGSGIWYTVSTKFVQVRMLPEMLRLLRRGFGEKTAGRRISSFQAFCVSTASRVGVGNIAGVSIAIVSGGPGAVFWMWVVAFWAVRQDLWKARLRRFTNFRGQTAPFTEGRRITFGMR